MQRGNGSQQDIRNSHVLTNTEDGRCRETRFVDPLIHFKNLMESSDRTVNSHQNASFFFYCYHPAEAFR